MKMSRFRISLLELLVVGAGAAFGVGLVVAGSVWAEVTVWSEQIAEFYMMGSVLLSITLGFAYPARRPQYLCYAWTATVFYYMTIYNDYLGILVRASIPAPDTIVVERWSIEKADVVEDTVDYVASMAVGMFCSWLTRSLYQSVPGLSKEVAK